ncbi:hypothetical protein J2X19_003688 [Rhodoferax ferrireducens]|uniref:Aminoacyl-tRNA synthetase n=1 Tax=Rhodoferax ferrireducens TaxID=192843 RepID=A0ABU2CCG0_9BURK|nr:MULTISPECIES: aminoacyl-tRNA synthetase [Rhodoferax]MDR7378994.1 hypothetical protein [Rhodoferax ferrireducens]SDP89735.1 hypothetical protein SAMN05216303_10924 [Rhodoferax sp. OV413]
MRMTDEEYFRSCVAKERQLAHLLGHHQIEECYESAGTLWEGRDKLPQWTRQWSACGPLLVQHRIGLVFGSDAAGGFVVAGHTTQHFADHPNPDRAVMLAVVKEVIHRLEHPKAVRAA